MSWFEKILCFYCCTNKPAPIKRNITLGCFGIDGSGKTTFLKMLKGEDPRNVLTTNGFSVIEMEYNPQFHLKIYDVGGDKGIRDIWSNYYGEVYGIIFVVDYSNDETFRESIEAMQNVTQHPQCAKKPILFVINNKNNQEIDDVEFSNAANLQATSDTQQQMIMITHINRYNGYLDKIKTSNLDVFQRSKKEKYAFQDQFVAFIELIVEHYVYLSEGVRSAELALKIKQQADKEKRKMIQMKEEHDARKADVAALEGRRIVSTNVQTTSNPTETNNENENKKDESPALSLASSTIPSDIIQGSPEVTPPSGAVNFYRISQTSTKPASPDEACNSGSFKSVPNDEYFLPPKLPGFIEWSLIDNPNLGRHTSRIQRIQSALSNRVAPI